MESPSDRIFIGVGIDIGTGFYGVRFCRYNKRLSGKQSGFPLSHCNVPAKRIAVTIFVIIFRTRDINRACSREKIL
jgi:hypothetical protein